MISQCAELHSITEQNVLFQNTAETPVFLCWKQASLWQVWNYTPSEAPFVSIIAVPEGETNLQTFIQHGHVHEPPFLLPSAPDFVPCALHIISPLPRAWRVFLLDSDNSRLLHLMGSYLGCFPPLLPLRKTRNISITHISNSVHYILKLAELWCRIAISYNSVFSSYTVVRFSSNKPHYHIACY